MIRHAKSIWIDTIEVNQYVEARQRFFIKEESVISSEMSAVASQQWCLQICADTEYVVYLNGNFVGFGQYRTFRDVKVYDQYDVSGFVRNGENEILVTAYCEGEDSQTYQQAVPMLAFAVIGESQSFLSGKDTEVRVHPCYESGRIEKVSPQLGYTYHYYADAAETVWKPAMAAECSFTYEQRPVKKLVVGELVAGRIYTQGTVNRDGEGTPAEMMQRDGLGYRPKKEIFDGNTLKYRKDGAFFVIDLGTEYAGLFSMEIEAAAGTVVDIGWGEHLEDMRVRTSVGSRNFACRYVCKAGVEKFTGYFRRFAGRFLQIHVTGMTGDVVFHRIGLIPTEYPLAREGFFECNDFLFNRLCEVSAHTLKLCMHEHYEDCPWREQALYAFDSYVQMLCGYYLFGEYEFAKASLKLLADSQRDDGMLRMCAPSGIRMAIPSFALVWVLSLEKYVLYSGDVAFGYRMMPVAERVFGAFLVKDGLVQNDMCRDNWHFYEWADGLDGAVRTSDGNSDAGQDAVINFYYILACEAYRKLCIYTGWEDGKIYHDPDRMRAAVREKYFDAQMGLFRTKADKAQYHELTQVLAVCSGTAQNQEDILDRVMDKENGLVKITLSTSLFKYEALLESGERYLDAVLEEIADIWGKMLFAGADTLWEVQEGAAAFGDAGSLCHGWSAVPVYLLYKYYLGFEPTAPGFREYRFKMQKTKHISEIRTVLYAPGWEKEIFAADGKMEIV